jgi:hypothetical protein
MSEMATRRSSIKNEELYTELRKDGDSKALRNH